MATRFVYQAVTFCSSASIKSLCFSVNFVSRRTPDRQVLTTVDNVVLLPSSMWRDVLICPVIYNEFVGAEQNKVVCVTDRSGSRWAGRKVLSIKIRSASVLGKIQKVPRTTTVVYLNAHQVCILSFKCHFLECLRRSKFVGTLFCVF